MNNTSEKPKEYRVTSGRSVLTLKRKVPHVTVPAETQQEAPQQQDAQRKLDKWDNAKTNQPESEVSR